MGGGRCAVRRAEKTGPHSSCVRPPPQPSPARGEGDKRTRAQDLKALPPCGGGLGWGGDQPTDDTTAVLEWCRYRGGGAEGGCRGAGVAGVGDGLDGFAAEGAPSAFGTSIGWSSSGS